MNLCFGHLVVYFFAKRYGIKELQPKAIDELIQSVSQLPKDSIVLTVNRIYKVVGIENKDALVEEARKMAAHVVDTMDATILSKQILELKMAHLKDIMPMAMCRSDRPWLRTSTPVLQNPR